MFTSKMFPSIFDNRSLITDTDGGVTSGQETQNEQTDNFSQAESIQSGASSDVEEGTNMDSRSRR